MKKFGYYLRTDLKGSLCSIKFATAVALAVGVLLLAAFEGIALDSDVLYVFSLVMYGMPAMILFICGAFAFADSFCEDTERRYMMQQIIRGSVET